jgi:glycosyltransferase involved in cell wall biosynthesis
MSILKRCWVRFYERFAFPWADLLLPVTDGIARWLVEEHATPVGAIRTVPNGVSLERFRPADRTACRVRFGLPPEAKIVGYLGSLFPWAGLDTLIDAAPEIVHHMPEALFVIGGGDEPCYSQWVERTRSAGLARHFRFFGAVDWGDASDLINSFDLCVAPALFKNTASGISSQKVLSYLACGKPVVGSDLCGLGDMLESNGVGMSFAMGDPRALASAVLRCLSDPLHLQRMQQSARQLVEQRYSWRETVKCTAGFLAQLKPV